MILDTSYLIHLFNRREDAFSKGLELAEERVIQRVPAPVVYEFTHGAEIAGTPEQARNVRNLLRMFPTVDLSPHIARRAGELHGQADLEARETKGGTARIDAVDPMVAAVADVLGEPVLTDNVDHFEALGVEVETYRV